MGTFQGFSELISAQTAAATSDLFVVGEGHTVTIVATALASGDEVPIQVVSGGTVATPTFSDCSTTGQTITETNNPVSVYGPGIFRINKGVTSGSVSVVKWEKP